MIKLFGCIENHIKNTTFIQKTSDYHGKSGKSTLTHHLYNQNDVTFFF